MPATTVTRAVCADFADAKGLRRARAARGGDAEHGDGAFDRAADGTGRERGRAAGRDHVRRDRGRRAAAGGANPRLAGLFDALFATDGHETWPPRRRRVRRRDTRKKDPVPERRGVAVTWGTI